MTQRDEAVRALAEALPNTGMVGPEHAHESATWLIDEIDAHREAKAALAAWACMFQALGPHFHAPNGSVDLAATETGRSSEEPCGNCEHPETVHDGTRGHCRQPDYACSCRAFQSPDIAAAWKAATPSATEPLSTGLREAAFERAWNAGGLHGAFVRLVASALPTVDDMGNEATDVAEGMAEHFYWAALAATPASEGTLDVERLARAMASDHEASKNHGNCVWSDDHRWYAEQVAAEYARLSEADTPLPVRRARRSLRRAAIRRG